jgi:hypothetical protein
MPVSAVAARAAGTWSVLFDLPLQAGALNAANWLITKPAGGGTVVATSASASGSTVSGTWVGGIGAPGTGSIEYAPPPFDVLSLATVAAPAFAGFPLPVGT